MIDTEARTVQLPPQSAEPDSVHSRLAPTDTHRLALQAKLTEIGVPPAPEDRGALRQLSELDAGSVTAVVRWLACAAAASDVHGDASPEPQAGTQPQAQPQPQVQAAPAAPAEPLPAAQAPAPPAPALRMPATMVRAARVLPVPDSATRIDPRLLAW